MATGVLQ